MEELRTALEGIGWRIAEKGDEERIMDRHGRDSGWFFQSYKLKYRTMHTLVAITISMCSIESDEDSVAVRCQGGNMILFHNYDKRV